MASSAVRWEAGWKRLIRNCSCVKAEVGTKGFRE